MNDGGGAGDDTTPDRVVFSIFQGHAISKQFPPHYTPPGRQSPVH